MSNPTSNFGWQMPTNSDLVTDLPADFEVFGQAVDTSLADLKGGTTGQILSKATNADMDFTWTNLNPGDITGVTATSPLTGGGTSGDVTIGIQSASTSQSGAVQLTDSTSSTSTSTAATPNSVKTAYDLANAAIPKSLVDAKGDIVTATADNTPARLAAGNNGEQLVADSTATSGLRWQATPSASNPVLNSNFSVWQRGTSFASLGFSSWTADRWFYYSGTNLGRTVSRQSTNDTTNLPNVQYCARVQRDSGTSDLNVFYMTNSFETINSIPFAGKTVTLSFYARAGANFSASSSQMSVWLASGTGTDQNIAAGYTGSSNIIAPTTATLTTTWQRFSYTGTVAATATEIGMRLGYTPTGTAGAADYLEFTGVQIDVGSVALPYRAYGATFAQELAACQRYYWRTSGLAYNRFAQGSGATSTQAQILVNNPVPMRVNATSVDYSTLTLYDQVNLVTVTGLTIETAGTLTNNLNVTVASGLTQYRPYMLLSNNSTSGYLGFSAEL